MKKFAAFGKPSIVYVNLLERMASGAGFRFRTGLLHRVKQFAPVCGLKLEEEIDQRQDVKPNLKLMGKSVELRDYQADSVNRALAHDMGVLYIATGGGKTHCAASLIAQRSVSTLFLVHTKDLLYQTKKRFEDLLGVTIGVIGDGVDEPGDITVATIQTLYNNVQAGLPLPKVDMIIQDEAHHVPAETFYAVTGGIAARYVYGLSATPYRKDDTDLMIEAAAGPIVARVSPTDLIARGILSKPTIRFIPLTGETSYSKAPRFAVINKYIVNNESRNRIIAETAIEQMNQNKTVLIAVDQVKHGKLIQALLPDATLLDGSLPSEERGQILNDLRERKIKIIISTLMKEGVDVPSLDVVINAAGGSDSMQLIGRALRRSEGKDGATIIDFIDYAHVSLHRNSLSRIRKCKSEAAFTVIVR
jgi:superfamily II DNA or RNA helicase